MKKLNKIIPILVFPLLLSACNGPQLHKPSFANYGRKVSFDYFAEKYNQKTEQARKYFYEGEDAFYDFELTTTKDFYIKCVVASITTDKYGKLETTAAAELTNIVKIDNTTHRSSAEFIEKDYEQSNLTENDPGYRPNRRTKKTEKVYTELVNGVVYYANVKNKTHTKFGPCEKDHYPTYAIGYSINAITYALFTVLMFNSYSSNANEDADNTTYYVNGNVFTLVQRMDDEYQKGKGIIQYKYSMNECSVKVFGNVTQTLDSVGDGPQTIIKAESAYELVIKRTNLSIEKLDHSGYSDDSTLVY